MSTVEIIFHDKAAAVRALANAGFSVGHNQRDDPRGIMFGLFDVQKWRNLSASDRNKLDGHMICGDPIRVRLHAADHIPAKAIWDVARASDTRRGDA